MNKEVTTKVVRVSFETVKHHQVFEEYQKYYKLAKGSTPGKSDIVILAMDNGGIPWLKDQIKNLKKEAKSNI